ncbi:hypothetical protein [Parasitella parasitica]|uniref:Uncharacterized protein n=1 Tax=Parasitella parasitica TaxID=35722 RepID=A0A0B7MYH4_9FUNG|nr:hypothetical protein [Parasitella parasitica]
MNNTQNSFPSTGHGTVDVPWSEDPKASLQDNQGKTNASSQKSTKNQHQQEQKNQDQGHHTGFGHATQHQHSPRSIKRDLNDI